MKGEFDEYSDGSGYYAARVMTPAKPLNVISMFSGMEAASVAARGLNWNFVAYAEVDPQACSVLHSIYGCGRPVYMPRPEDVEGEGNDADEKRNARAAAIRAVAHLPEAEPGCPVNWGDMTQVDWSQYRGKVDLVVGGPPCQDLSVAGLRAGATGSRGNLTLEYMRAIYAIEPLGALTEQVPGILSDKGNAFGQYLGGLVGHDAPITLGKRQQWTREGVVAGPGGVAAWRCLDAQGFVAQRRLRVFVFYSRDVSRLDCVRVLFETEADAFGSLGERACTGPLFPEREGMRGDLAAGREQGAVAAALAANGVGTCGADDNQAQAGHLIPVAYGGGNTAGPIDVSTAMVAHPGGRYDFDSETFVTSPFTDTAMVAFRTSPNCGAWETGDRVDALTTGTDPTSHLIAYPLLEPGARTGSSTTDVRAGMGIGADGDPMYTLQAGKQHGVAVAFALNSHAGCADGDQTNRSHANGGPVGMGVSEECAYSLRAGRTQSVAMAFQERGREGGRSVETSEELAYALTAPNGGGRRQELNVAVCEGSHGVTEMLTATSLQAGGGKPGQGYQAVRTGMSVRRLLPVECLKLQSFPPDYLDAVTHRGTPLPDGARYKLVGNSWNVEVVRWIFNRIDKAYGGW